MRHQCESKANEFSTMLGLLNPNRPAAVFFSATAIAGSQALAITARCRAKLAWLAPRSSHITPSVTLTLIVFTIIDENRKYFICKCSGKFAFYDIISENQFDLSRSFLWYFLFLCPGSQTIPSITPTLIIFSKIYEKKILFYF